MRNWRKARVEQLDSLLEREPGAVEARCERAALLRELNMFEEAKRDYLELLRRKPADAGVLNDFGTLALKAGYRSAARSLFEEAVRHHPDNPMARVNLANLLLLIGEHEAARAHFEAALRADPGHIHAHRGLGNLLAEAGDAAGARRHRDLGFKNDFLVTLPYRGDGVPVRILLLVSAAGGNTPTATLLDDLYFQASVLVAEYYDGKTPLPPHDLVFNAIGDADICGEGLQAARAILARTRQPVINDPRAVARTGRLANARRLGGLPGVIAPRMVSLPRRSLANAEAAEVVARNGFSFPVLARAPGFHTGYHFIRAESAEELAAAVEKFPGEEVWLIEQLDARDGEGTFRKFRVMIVDRKIYPLHLAISRNWKVHYFTADMAESADNRAKEVAFLHDMAEVVGPRGMAALERIAAALDLDYGGIDFAVSAGGDILFFEGNATMVMIPLPRDDKWTYRRPAFDRVFAAVRGMLMERAAERATGGRTPGALAQ
ncbi:MAG TPA: tetratricopeptide repeat protein [Xanthobacteraceae bacterium]|nr:tetratricopeptide repeat protein [Xanthobacteraceae bacterium]